MLQWKPYLDELGPGLGGHQQNQKLQCLARLKMPCILLCPISLHRQQFRVFSLFPSIGPKSHKQNCPFFWPSKLGSQENRGLSPLPPAYLKNGLYTQIDILGCVKSHSKDKKKPRMDLNFEGQETGNFCPFWSKALSNFFYHILNNISPLKVIS